MNTNFYIKNTGGLIQNSLFAPERRVVSGYYTNDNVDMYGHVIDKDGMLQAVNDYRQWGTVREMHENPIGVAQDIGYPEWNYIAAKIASTPAGNNVLQLVQDGVYGAFSVGIIVTRAEWIPVTNIQPEKFMYLPDNIRSAIVESGSVLSIREMTLLEVSIVDRPANPAAKMSGYIKSFAGDHNVVALPPAYHTDYTADKLLDGVIVDPRSKVLVDAKIKSVLSTEQTLRSEDMEQQEEIKVAVSEEEVIEVATPVVTEEAEVEQASGDDTNHPTVVAEKSIDVAAEQYQKLADLVYNVNEFVIELSAKIDEVAQRVNAMHDVITAENEAVNEQTKETQGDGDALDPLQEKIVALDELITKFAEILEETQSGQIIRKASVSPIESNTEQPVDIKKMSEPEIRNLLANRIARAFTYGG